MADEGFNSLLLAFFGSCAIIVSHSVHLVFRLNIGKQ